MAPNPVHESNHTLVQTSVYYTPFFFVSNIEHSAMYRRLKVLFLILFGCVQNHVVNVYILWHFLSVARFFVCTGDFEDSSETSFGFYNTPG
jgi:hypothetical protein